jgi:hypothetical protein
MTQMLQAALGNGGRYTQQGARMMLRRAKTGCSVLSTLRRDRRLLHLDHSP